MKILLDHNIDRRFARLLPDFDVATTQQMGWVDLLNGELLLRAEQDGFEAFITADSNLSAISKTSSVAASRSSCFVRPVIDFQSTPK